MDFNLKRLKYLLFISIVILLWGKSFAQAEMNSFYAEIHPGLLISFGPEGKQAEIMGGYNASSFDNKNHYIVGFKECFIAEAAVGYHFKYFDLEGDLGYLKQDIGLAENLYGSQQFFMFSDLLSLKLVFLYDEDTIRSKGFSGGPFIRFITPISSKMSESVKNNYGFEDFQPNIQLNWGFDFRYILQLNKSGAYLIGGASLTLPGIVGSIGHIELQPSSSYTIVNDDIKMYSGQVFIGFGYGFPK